MWKIVACLTGEHDLRFVAVAAIVCLLSSIVTFRLYARVLAAPFNRRWNWLILTGLTAGAGTWATHFIAMLAYRPGFQTGYLAAGTIVSLILPAVFATLGFALVSIDAPRPQLRRACAGLMIAGGVGLMHFTGMAAFRTQGLVLWDYDYIVAALLVGGVLAVGALLIAGDLSRRWRAVIAPVGLTAAISGLHFTGMSAVSILPDRSVVVPASAMPHGAMIGLVSVSALLIIAAAIGVIWADAVNRRATLSTLRGAIEALADGIAYFDPAGRCILWNQRYADLAPAGVTDQPGFTLRDLLLKGLEEGRYAAAKGHEAEWLEQRLAANANPSGPIEHELQDGSWLRVEERRTPDGGMVTSCVDVTKHKQRESELRATAETLKAARDEADRANRAKSQFLANMSHEIRTPLNGVVAVVDLLSRTPLNAAQEEMVHLVRSSAGSLERLLTDLLDLARVESGKVQVEAEPFDIAEVLRGVTGWADARAAEKGLTVVVNTGDLRATVLGDAGRLRQILTNLTSNAIKFTETGSVEISVDAPDQGDVWRFTVADTGIGFDETVSRALFERFEQADGSITRRFGGTGLGLAISSELAELMGGDLTCESVLGEGSIFRLTLPLPSAGAAAITADGPEPLVDLASQRRLRVLLADDHPTNRKVIELMLAGLDVELVQVENGLEACVAVEAQPFDVILMDMQMPVLDGLSANRRIREHERQEARLRTPIIMLTANAMPDHVLESLASGADRHVCKPVQAAALFGAIQDLLAGDGVEKAA